MNTKLLPVIIAILFATTSFACSCVEFKGTFRKQIEKSFSESDVIVLGKVVGIKKLNSNALLKSSADPVIYTFEIQNILKGKLEKEVIEIVSASDGASCGYVFETGKSYLVYSRTSNFFAAKTNNAFDYSTGLCSRNQELKKVRKKELRKLSRLQRRYNRI